MVNKRDGDNVAVQAATQKRDKRATIGSDADLSQAGIQSHVDGRQNIDEAALEAAKKTVDNLNLGGFAGAANADRNEPSSAHSIPNPEGQNKSGQIER